MTTHACKPVEVTFGKEEYGDDDITLTGDGLATSESDNGECDIYAVDALGRKVIAHIQCVEKLAQLSAAVTPAAASNKAVVWTSSDPAVMKVDKKGVVTVSKTATPGVTATITATAADGSGVTASRLVRVTQPVTAIVVTAETGNGYVNYKGYLQLNAAVSPAFLENPPRSQAPGFAASAARYHLTAFPRSLPTELALPCP